MPLRFVRNLVVAALVWLPASASAQALELLQRRCDEGHAMSCRALGWLVKRGLTVPGRTAPALLERSCDLGAAVACDDLVELYRDSRPELARKFQLAAAKLRAADAGVSTAPNTGALILDVPAPGDTEPEPEVAEPDAGPPPPDAGPPDAGPPPPDAVDSGTGAEPDAGMQTIVHAEAPTDAGTEHFDLGRMLRQRRDARHRVVSVQRPDGGMDETPEGLEAAEALLKSAFAPKPPLFNCIEESERERLRVVQRARAEKSAFQPSAVWLPPLFMTDAERSYYWSVLYFQVADFDDGTKTRVLPPLFLSMCAPSSRTLITPVYSERTDAEGTARLILTYFQRRDRLAESDVLFPIFWSLREREQPDGEWTTSNGALLPFAFWGRKTTGDYFTFVPPLFWSWGDAKESTSILANVYWRSSQKGSAFGVVPFLFHAREGASYHDLVPPLVWSWGDEHGKNLIAGPVFSLEDELGWSAGVVPFWFAGGHQGFRYDLVPPLLAYHSSSPDESTTFVANTYYQRRADGYTLASVPFVFAGRTGNEHHFFIPPLLTFHTGDGTTESTVVANTYWRSSPTGWKFHFAPLLFLGRGDSDYTFVPPLFWRWGDATETTTIAANVYWYQGQTSHHLGVVPFFFSGDTPEGSYDIVPPLVWRWSSERKQTNTLIVGPVFRRESRNGWTLGVVPFFALGERNGKHWTVVPPLLTYHEGDETKESTWVANVFFEQRTTGWTLDVVPFLFTAVHGEEHHTFVPPLFWRWGDPYEDTTIAGPGFLHFNREGGWHAGLAPLWFGGLTDGTRYDVVPPLLFFRTSSAERTRGFLINTFFTSSKDDLTVASVPFAFFHREGREHWLLIPPLLTYHQGDGQTETTWALNTYYQRRPDGFTLTSLPLVFAGREGPSHYTFVPPLFWRWGDAEATTTLVGNVFWRSTDDGGDLGIAPLYFRGRHGKAFYDVVFPFFARWGEGDESHTAIFVPGYHVKTDDGWHAGLTPVWFGGKVGDTRYDVIPPLLFAHTESPERRRTYLINTFYTEGKDDSTLLSVPFVYAHHEGKEHQLLIPPLLTYHEGDGELETTWAVNTYYQRRPTGFTLASVPFLFAGAEREAFYTFVPPLFWRWGDALEQTTIAATAFWHSDPEGTHVGFAPFWFKGRYGSTTWDVGAPLFARWSDATSHTLLIPPLLTVHHGEGDEETTWAFNTYYQHRKDGFTLMSLPLVFAGADQSTRYTVVAPLFWHFADDIDQTSTTIAANVFWHTNHSAWDAGVAPLWFGGSDGARRYDLIPPLLFYRSSTADETTVWAAQTYYHRWNGGFSLASLPFLFAGRDQDSHYTVVPPLFWRWGDSVESTTIAGPVFWHEDAMGTHAGFAPFYFRGRYGDRSWDVGAPLFARWSDATSHSLLIPPLLTYHHGEGDEETTWALNTYYSQRKDGFTLTSLPLVFAGADRFSRYTVVAPLFWHFANTLDGTNTTVVGNVFWHQGLAGWDAGVAPLWFGGADGERRYDLVPPLLFYRSSAPDETTVYAAQTYFHRWKGGFTLASVPFVFAGTDADTHYTVVPPLFWRWGSRSETTTIAGPVFWHDAPDGHDLGVAPLFFEGRHGDSHYLHLLPPLVMSWGDATHDTFIAGPAYSRHTPEGSHFGFAPLYFGGRGESSYDIAPPLFWHFKDAASESLVAGPFYRFADKSGEDLGFFPLWFGGRHGGNEWDFVAPLFFRRSSPDSRSLMVLPFFRYSETRTDRLLLSPLFVYSKSESYEATVVAALYWRMKGPDTDATIAFPFYWDIRSPQSGTRLTTVFPVYWRYEKPSETTHLFLNVMVSFGQTPRGRSWSFHFFPLIDLASYNPEHFLWQILAGALGHETQDERERWRFGWIWTEPTTRR